MIDVLYKFPKFIKQNLYSSLTKKLAVKLNIRYLTQYFVNIT